jgi:hypothetical protein
MKTNKPLRAKTPLKAKASLKASKTPKKQAKPAITLLKHRADILFSKAVRYRDGKIRNGEWWCECITCGTWNPMGKTHAGHFMPRGRLATRWDYENVNAQCPGCNTFRAGEQYKYGLALEKKYGDGTAVKLFNQSKKEIKINRIFLEEIITTAKTEIAFYEEKL